ncbi:MAG: DUF4262 domain-containing protein [Bacteroidia bacterium]
MSDNECEGYKNGLEAMHKRHDELLKKYGWMVHFVTPDDDYPFKINIHTHGFPEKFNHPDMQICLPLSPDYAQGIMHNIARKLEKGKVFKANKKYKNIIEGFAVLIHPATEDGREVLRIVFPDKHGSFDSQFSESQLKDIT